MPVCCLNSMTIFCACSIGVEVYQFTLPSARALATATVSWAWAGLNAASASTAAHSMSLNLSILFFLLSDSQPVILSCERRRHSPAPEPSQVGYSRLAVVSRGDGHGLISASRSTLDISSTRVIEKGCVLRR